MLKAPRSHPQAALHLRQPRERSGRRAVQRQEPALATPLSRACRASRSTGRRSRRANLTLEFSDGDKQHAPRPLTSRRRSRSPSRSRAPSPSRPASARSRRASTRSRSPSRPRPFGALAFKVNDAIADRGRQARRRPLRQGGQLQPARSSRQRQRFVEELRGHQARARQPATRSTRHHPGQHRELHRRGPGADRLRRAAARSTASTPRASS